MVKNYDNILDKNMAKYLRQFTKLRLFREGTVLLRIKGEVRFELKFEITREEIDPLREDCSQS